MAKDRFDIKEKEGVSFMTDADGKPIITKDGYKKLRQSNGLPGPLLNIRKPASEWIQHYAAHELTKLLSDKKLSLTDITDRMGFSSQAVLTRYLKHTLGMTPSEFRRKS